MSQPAPSAAMSRRAFAWTGLLGGLSGLAGAGLSVAARAQTPATPPPQVPAAAPQGAGPAVSAPVLRPDQASLLLQTLGAVSLEGFPSDAFIPAGVPSLTALSDLLSSDDADDQRRGQGLLKDAIFAYARAQRGFRLKAAAFDKNWGMRPQPYDVQSDFNLALTGDRLAAWVQGLPPPCDRYRGLRDALAKLRAISASGGWGLVRPGPELKVGAEGARVLDLRQRLAAGDPGASLDTTASTFDAALASAVATFQHNVGLNQTGVVDKTTLAALNIPVAARISQIEANMERWRWVPRILPETRIEVNIAAEEMDAFQDNAIVLEMRAAPGRLDDQTPILSSEVQSVVFDPPWNVPTSIATKEYWPKEAAHPGYLASHGFKVISTPDGAKRLQQKFGPKSALGKIKFDFPNTYSVYLHDTPSHAAFSRTSRAVSHGCVRLQRPKELADLLFRDDQDWSADRIAQVIAAGRTVRAPLDDPMPIFLMYWTAFLDVKGRINFRNDVYGWDTELMGLIAADPSKPLASAG